MAAESADSTELPQVPVSRRRYVRHRTGLVAPSDERQLELPWTQAPTLEPEAAEPEKVTPGTEDPQAVAEPQPQPSPHEIAKRAYPLAYDPDGPAGPALKLLNEVHELAESITEAYAEGDIASVGSRLPVIAAVLGKAYPHTAFNPALGSAVSFLRRATLLASADQCGSEELMGLAKAVRQITENPLISLDDAADLLMHLEAQGWVGADSDVAEFVNALFGEAEPAATQQQKQDVIGAGK